MFVRHAPTRVHDELSCRRRIDSRGDRLPHGGSGVGIGIDRLDHPSGGTAVIYIRALNRATPIAPPSSKSARSRTSTTSAPPGLTWHTRNSTPPSPPPTAGPRI